MIDAAPLTRIAVIGDIHAQDQLLDAALRAIAALRVDAIACTGDVVDGSGSVERCCSLLREHNVLCVRGNHDRWVFTGILRTPAGTCVQQLSADSQRFLRNLPRTRELLTTNGVMLLCHGIGEFDLEKITSYDTDYSFRTNQRLQDVISGGKYRLMVNGHSHERLVLRVGELTIVNAGTLTDPEDPGFVLLDFDRNVVQWHQLRSTEGSVPEERTLL